MTHKIYVVNTNSNSVTVIYNFVVLFPTVEIPVGSKPVAIAVNELTTKVYVANTGLLPPNAPAGTTVTVINGANDSKITDVTVGLNPSAIACDPPQPYNDTFVTNLTSNTVSVIAGNL